MQHFLDLTDWTPDEIDSLLTLATDLKREWQHGGNRPLLKGKVLAMVFQKPSLRTRVSFDVAMLHLGGHALYLSPTEIGLGQRESIGDVARVLSGYTQGIMARVYEHTHLLELASASRVPVINGLSDRSHPCQVLADLLTIRNHFGKLPGLRVAYVGDTNNVTRSLATGVARTGMALAIASPHGYAPDADFLREADESELRLTVTKNPVEAVHNADVIYTDTWVSMGQEAETDKRLVALRNYQVNSALLAAAPKHAIVLHCLPAHRGVEITDDVMDGPQSAVFAQAENRLHAQKAILVRLMAE
ncbi:MAG: ornithine carbamoyltransferase [Aggregatilineales bacterium]